MQDLIKNLEDGFVNQDIYYLKGYDKDNNELHFIRYFETNNRIKNMDIVDNDGLPCSMYFEDFNIACNKFLNICKDVEIVCVMGDKIPLYNFINNIDFGRKQYA